MCGIAGFLEPDGQRSAEDCHQIARRMAAALAHRGPDHQGTWVDARAGVALGHRRLAILDLSAEGEQPMHSLQGRYVLSYNGEIYNCGELRERLEGCGLPFRGHSDTEVLLAAVTQWGLPSALSLFTGMFAFALWDRQSRSLSLVRDRAGEKPLYYGWAGGAFIFGSELKALRAHPQWQGDVARNVLPSLVRYGYVPAPHCIYENTYKLPPGCLLTLTEKDILDRRMGRPEPYWSLPKVAAAGAADPFDGNEEEAADQLVTLLTHSISRQMVADVPVGAFLSGGIDSSLVVALMQAQSRRPIRTFSIGFPQKELNEARHAEAVARHLGTDHTELYVEARNMLGVIPQLPGIYDEPFADPSQIPTVLLCQLARAQVKVSLSGDAGDELFAGYTHYRKAQLLWKLFGRIPERARQRLAGWLRSAAGAGGTVENAAGFPGRMTDRLLNLSELLPATSDRALCQLLISPNRNPDDWLKKTNTDEPETPLEGFASWNNLPTLLQRMQYLDLSSYLPDDILVKVDRAAMAVGLETRIPLLDHRLVEFAWRLSAAFPHQRAQGKWLLRRLLFRHVPPQLVDRPKKGFGAPVGQWLRGPLRDWGEGLLEATRLRQEGFFEPRQVRQKWREHLTGQRDWSAGLWHVLMFQAWLNEQKASVVSDSSVAMVAV